MLLMNPKEQLTKEDSVSQLGQTKEDDKIVKHSDSYMDRENMLSTERKDENMVSAYPVEKQGMLLFY